MIKYNRRGQKLYPVCSFNANQHKLYNAYDRIMIAYYEGEDVEEARERIENAIDAFNSGADRDGLVYATYQDGQIIKDYIAAYNARH